MCLNLAKAERDHGGDLSDERDFGATFLKGPRHPLVEGIAYLMSRIARPTCPIRDWTLLSIAWSTLVEEGISEWPKKQC